MGKTAAGHTPGIAMTLFKQIALLITAVLTVLLLIIVVNDLDRTSRFQQGQLQTTAQDMVTTLGIAISNLPDGKDPATLEVLFNAVFDSGYYSRIELVGTDGTTIHQKSRALAVEGVPDWFLERVPLRHARGATQVMQGWTQLGRLSLEIHPGFAYRNLYDNLVSTLQWFALLFFVSMTVLWLVLRYILAPLQLVREQADAIHGNRFVQQEKIPATLELKRVVEAMNLMVGKVQDIFDDQEKTLQDYQQLLYRDKLTGLGNRRYLLDQLQQSLAEGADTYSCMAIVKIVDYEQLRDHQGYEAADNLIHILSDLLRQAHAGLETDCLSRFNDDEFAFLSSEAESVVVEFMHGMFDSFQMLVHTDPELAGVQLQAGICDLEAGAAPGNVLASIDYCLSKAQNNGPFSVKCRPSTNLYLPQGKMQWRGWLEKTLNQQQFFLVGQLVLRGAQPIQRELFIRARDQDEQIVPASAFMPMAASLGMSLDIDREVFRLVISNPGLNRSIPLAINLSAAFFELAEAQPEFERLLEECTRTDTRLCVEASHHILIRHPIMCSKISERLRRDRHQFGVDNLDFGLPMQLLKSGQFDYVKINAGTLQEISRDDIPGGFQALRTITDTLDIEIVAVAVDSQQLSEKLQAIGIDALQGNYLGEPAPI